MTRIEHRAAMKPVLAIMSMVTAVALGIFLFPLSATAAPTYTLSGQITYGAAPGAIAPDTMVRIYALTGAGGEARAGYYAYSNQGGAWSISGVPAGRYRIEFDATDYDNAANAPIWYGDTPYEDQATVVTVDGDVSGLDVTQVASGTISGTVTGPFHDASTFRAYLWNPTTGLFEMVRSVANANTRGTGNYTISGLNPGKYLVRFADFEWETPTFSTQYFKDSTDMLSATLVTVAAGQNVTGIDGSVGSWGWYSGRIDGPDRFSTATTISSEFFSPGNANVIYVANGLSYPDALSASAAAAYRGGPLLLVTPSTVPAVVTDEINRLKPPEIVVVGGPAAVSADVYNQLAKLAPKITRESGADRYATSRAIARDAFPDSRNSVFVATGANYPDALVAGSAAGYEGSPLILVDGAASSLDTATMQLINTLNPLRTYVVGGAATVSTGIQHSLENRLGATTVLRLGGANRFLTAQSVNSQVFPFADSAFVATALGFADALSISAVAGVVGAPLVLATPTCIPEDEVAHATQMGVSTYWIVGGLSALGDAVENLTACDPVLYSDALRAGAAKSARTAQASPINGVNRAQPSDAGFVGLIHQAHVGRK